jgi:YebC/PmpR family DNA-binding regulatory protein
MSGHSKWHSIKHQKAAADAKRGAAFTKLANQITIAAKQGGGETDTNFKLRLAIAKAKAGNMPSANIERAIKKGTGELGGAQVEEILYEGYGPGGVAVLVEVATDNRNRTASEVRSAFTKHGGRMAEAGAVAFQFDQKGQIVVGQADDEAELAAIDAGADDTEIDDGKLYVYTSANRLEQVRSALADQHLPIESAELAYIPRQPVTISDAKTAGQVMKIMETLDELDDVTETYANFDLASELEGASADTRH